MSMNKRTGLSRRLFLKAATGGGVAGVGLALPNVSPAAKGDGALATLIDLSLCDGCPDKEIPVCVAACKSLNRDRRC